MVSTSEKDGRMVSSSEEDGRMVSTSAEDGMMVYSCDEDGRLFYTGRSAAILGYLACNHPSTYIFQPCNRTISSKNTPQGVKLQSFRRKNIYFSIKF